MATVRTEIKVGLFVLVGLVLFAALLLSFSKGLKLFTPVYQIKMKTTNVGGIKTGASVTMLGVYVGSVKSATIDPDGRSVTVLMEIDSNFKIRRNANFTIEQAGFLGDQFVAIIPGEGDDAPYLEEGDLVTSNEPFNIGEMARSAAGLLQRVDTAAKTFNDIMERLDRLVLNEQTLTNLSVAVANFREVSKRADSVMADVEQLVDTNGATLTLAVTNLTKFSEDLGKVTADLKLLLAENKESIHGTLTNFQAVSSGAKAIVDDVQAGKGLVGGLLRDEKIIEEIRVLLENTRVATSNIANYGLLYKPKKPEKPKPLPTDYPGKSPFK